MFEGVEISIKWIIAITGFVSIIIKFIDISSNNRLKRNLKSDLELLNSVDRSYFNEEDKKELEEQIKITLTNFLDTKESKIKLFDWFYALVIFIGFGWWTIYLYQINSQFNPWSILTGVFSVIGLTMLTDRKLKNKVAENVLVTIKILKGFGASIGALALGLFLSFFVYTKNEGYSNWYILCALIVLLSSKGIYDSIKINR